MEAAIARIDVRAPGQLAFLYSLIRQQPRAQWTSLLSKYITFPMANNVSDHALYKIILENEWRQWIWPFFERKSVHDLLSRQEERSLFTVSMNIFAMVHHYVFMNQSECFGKVVEDTFADLQEFAGWDDESIMLARLMLYASANKITSSAPSVQTLKRDLKHAGWSNLFQLYSVIEHFILCAPSSVSKLNSKNQCGFHIDEDGVFLDLLLIEQCIKILKDALRIDTIVDASESDKKLASRQKQLQKLGIEHVHYFVQLYGFFQAFEEGKAAQDQTSEIVKIVSIRNRINKNQFKECIESLALLLEQQKRNQHLAAAASVARRVYFKVNDTIQVRNEPPATQPNNSPNAKLPTLGALKTQRQATMDHRESSFEDVIPVLNVTASKKQVNQDKATRLIHEIRNEIQQQTASNEDVGAAVTDNNQDTLATFTVQFIKLQAAFEDYKRILKLGQRAVFELSDASKVDVAQREDQTLLLMSNLTQHLRSRADELRTLGLQAMKKQEEDGANFKEDGGCLIQ